MNESKAKGDFLTPKNYSAKYFVFVKWESLHKITLLCRWNGERTCSRQDRRETK